jgi:hypothetical protein
MQKFKCEEAMRHLARDSRLLDPYISAHGHFTCHHPHNHHPDYYPGAGARRLNASARRPVRGGAVFSPDR